MASYILEQNLGSLPLQKKYRSHLDIMALILDTAKDRSKSRFSISRQANINYIQLKKFLNSLLQMRFIEMDVRNGVVMYRTGERGRIFLRQYCVLLGMIASANRQGLQQNALL